MKLKRIDVKSFGGINPKSPVVIDFSKDNVVNISGDNGTCKTSLINALLVACGHLSKENKNFVNNESGKIDIDFDFEGKDRYNYQVKVTKSAFKLMYDGEAVPEPITKMKELLGVVGVSPMEVKQKPLKDIIKWLSSYSNKSPEEYEAQMEQHKQGVKACREVRAKANKSAKANREFLEAEEMYVRWEQSEIDYAEAVDIKELSAKLKSAGDNSDKYIKSEAGLKTLREKKTTVESDLEELRRKIAEKEAELADIDKRVSTGEKWLKENKSFKTEYDAIRQQYDNAAEHNASYNKWQQIKQKKSEMDEFETIAQNADAKEKELIRGISELQSEILPDFKGVELVLEDTHEDGGVVKKEGLYVDGKNVAQLSETEWWAFVMKIWRKFKVKIIVIDNMQSLGSSGVELLEKLAKDGAYILAAEMNREQKTLHIEYGDLK